MIQSLRFCGGCVVRVVLSKCSFQYEFGLLVFCFLLMFCVSYGFLQELLFMVFFMASFMVC